MEGQPREGGSSETTEAGPQAVPKVGDPGANSGTRQSATPSNGQSADSSSAPGDGKPSTLAEKAPGASAGSALPDISQDLLKKAAEMRANNLTAADIEQVRKAAEGLLKDLSAKDLTNLANSKEIQQTLEQLARRIDPQQMEQLARQLLSQKEIRDELQAVGKLLLENRQAKETIAGFADKAREIAEEFKKQGYKPGSPPDAKPLDLSGQAADRAGDGSPSTYGQAKSNTTRVLPRGEPLKRMGQSGEVPSPRIKSGNISDLKQEGEPIYGRPNPRSAPARVPYSTAYPGYRREAERSVQRSQVPPRLRTLIRNYFDAINPDAEKHP